MADILVTQDPTKPGISKVNGPTMVSGKIPLSGLDPTGANNGDVIALTGGVWMPSAAPPSTDTASNLGAGGQVFKSKVGADFQFRSIVAGSNITVTQNANDLTIASTASGGSFTEQFTSTEQTWTAGSTTTLAHGLTGAPKLFRFYLICKTAESGWSIGDIFECCSADTGGGTNKLIYSDATNINVMHGVGGFLFFSRATFNDATLTAANWNMVVQAWR